jgi:hypothetical protein
VIILDGCWAERKRLKNLDRRDQSWKGRFLCSSQVPRGRLLLRTRGGRGCSCSGNCVISNNISWQLQRPLDMYPSHVLAQTANSDTAVNAQHFAFALARDETTTSKMRRSTASLRICCTSGCPWPKVTVKSPVGARDLRPVQPPRTLSAFMFGFVARFG